MDTTLTSLVKGLLSNHGLYLIGAIIVALFVVYIVLCFVAWAAERQRERIAKSYRPKKVMEAEQESFFNLLHQAITPDLYVFPQVSMRALVETNHLNIWAPFMLKRVDFVVCSKKLSIVCVIELEGDKQEERHRRREKLLQNAGIIVLRYKLSENPTAEQIRRDIGKITG